MGPIPTSPIGGRRRDIPPRAGAPPRRPPGRAAAPDGAWPGVGRTAPLPTLGFPAALAGGAMIRRVKRQPPLWPITVALLVALIVVALTLDAELDPGLDPSLFVNAALVIIGGVLLLSAWRGRAGWTMLLAVPLLPLWAAFSAADIGRFAGLGDRSVTIAEPAEATRVFEHGYGGLRVTVEPEAVPAGTTLRLATGTTAGATIVDVPEGASVVVRADIGVGGLSVQGDTWWERDEAFVLNRERRVTSPPLEHVCFSWEMTPAEARSYYEPFLFGGSGRADHEFIDEDGNALVDEAHAVLGPDAFDEAAFQLPVPMVDELHRFGEPLPEPIETAQGLRWRHSTDEFGRPCDPAAPPPGADRHGGDRRNDGSRRGRGAAYRRRPPHERRRPMTDRPAAPPPPPPPAARALPGGVATGAARRSVAPWRRSAWSGLLDDSGALTHPIWVVPVAVVVVIAALVVATTVRRLLPR